MPNSFPKTFRATDAKFLDWDKPAPGVEEMLMDAFRKAGAPIEILNSIMVIEAPLKFFKDASVVAFTATGWDQDLFFLRNYRGINLEFPLLGTNEPIYRMGELSGLVLTPASQLEYARFFFHFVRGNRGNFQIVEKADQIQWTDNADEKLINEANDLLMPLTYRGQQPDGVYRNTATMIFRDAIFKCDLLVSSKDLKPIKEYWDEPFKRGETRLADEQLLLENLPIKDVVKFDDD